MTNSHNPGNVALWFNCGCDFCIDELLRWQIEIFDGETPVVERLGERSFSISFAATPQSHSTVQSFFGGSGDALWSSPPDLRRENRSVDGIGHGTDGLRNEHEESDYIRNLEESLFRSLAGARGQELTQGDDRFDVGDEGIEFRRGWQRAVTESGLLCADWKVAAAA